MKNNLLKKVLSCVVAVAILAGLAVPTMAEPTVPVPPVPPVPPVAQTGSGDLKITATQIGKSLNKVLFITDSKGAIVEGVPTPGVDTTKPLSTLFNSTDYEQIKVGFTGNYADADKDKPAQVIAVPENESHLYNLQLFAFAPDSAGDGTTPKDAWWNLIGQVWGGRQEDTLATIKKGFETISEMNTFYATGSAGTYKFKLKITAPNEPKTVFAETDVITVTIGKRDNDISKAIVTLDGGAGDNKNEYIYTGKAIEPTFTVKMNNKVVNPDDLDGYTVAYSNNTDVPDWTADIYPRAIITLTGKGKYAGSTKDVIFQIKPKEITVNSVTLAPKVYDGQKREYASDKDTIVKAIEMNGLLKNEKFKIGAELGAEVNYDNADVGTNHKVDIKVYLENAGSVNTRNYFMTGNAGMFTRTDGVIIKAPAPVVIDHVNKAYEANKASQQEVDISEFVPVNSKTVISCTVGEVTGNAVKNASVTATTNVVTGNVKFKVKFDVNAAVASVTTIPVIVESKNFENVIVNVNVTLADKVATITGNGKDSKYTGKPFDPATGLKNVTVKPGTPVYEYKAIGETTYTKTPPTDPDSYRVKITSSDSSVCGELVFMFYVDWIRLNIKPDDVTIDQGKPLPVFNETTTGEKEGDKLAEGQKFKPLAGENYPLIECLTTDGKTPTEPGTYDIISKPREVWTADDKTETTANYNIKYTKGTLTIRSATDPSTIPINSTIELSGIDTPVAGAKPDKTATTTVAGVDVAVNLWKGDSLDKDGYFKENSTYTCDLKLTPKAGYAFPAIEKNAKTLTLTGAPTGTTYANGAIQAGAKELFLSITFPKTTAIQKATAPLTAETITKTQVATHTATSTKANTGAVAGATLKVYAATDPVELTTVKCTLTADNRLTIANIDEFTDLKAQTYYVTQTETGKSESARVAITVKAKTSIFDGKNITATFNYKPDDKSTITLSGTTEGTHTGTGTGLNASGMWYCVMGVDSDGDSRPDYDCFFRCDAGSTEVPSLLVKQMIGTDYKIWLRDIDDETDSLDIILTEGAAITEKIITTKGAKGTITITGKENSKAYECKGPSTGNKWAEMNLDDNAKSAELKAGKYQIRLKGTGKVLSGQIKDVEILTSIDKIEQTGIEITTPPTDTDFKVGSGINGKFSDVGMKVSKVYNDGSKGKPVTVTGNDAGITTVPANGHFIAYDTEGVVAKWGNFTSPIAKFDKVRFILISPQDEEEILSGKGGEATFLFVSSDLKTENEPFKIIITATGSGITETEDYEGYTKPVAFEGNFVTEFKFTIPSTIKAGTYNFTVFADSDTSNLLDGSAASAAGTIVVKQAPPPVLPPVSGGTGSTGSTGTDSTGSGSTAPTTEPVVTAPPAGSTNTATEVKYDDVKTAAPEVTGETTVAAAAITLDETTAATATAAAPIEVKAALSTADAASTINAATTKAVDFAFTVSDSIAANEHVRLKELTVGRDILQAAATAGKDLTFAVKSTKGTPLFSMSFKGSELKGKNLTDVNLALNVVEPSATIAKALPFASVLSFENNGAFPAPCTVTVNVTDMYKDGAVLNLYYDNVKKGTLDLVKQGITVAFGEAEATIDHASDYILSTALINTTSKPSINPATGVASTGVALLGQLF